MEHMLGPNWIELFEFVGVSASKPLFYTGTRPFRLVSAFREARLRAHPAAPVLSSSLPIVAVRPAVRDSCTL